MEESIKKKIDKAPETKEESSHSAKTKPTTAHDAEIESSYKVAYLQLTSIYTERLIAVSKAIKQTNGDVSLLNPDMKQEIKSLQNILPEDQRKTLDKLLDPESRDKLSTKALEDNQRMIAEQLAGVISGALIECAKIVGNQGLMSLEKPQSVSLAEIDTSHLRGIPNVKKPEQQSLDMNYYERRSKES